MIPAAIERNYPKRLLAADWWHMSLFQQPAGYSFPRRMYPVGKESLLLPGNAHSQNGRIKITFLIG